MVLGISLLFAVFAARIHHPLFQGSWPSRIDIQAWQHATRENFETSITDHKACRSVMEVLEQGTWTMPHMCKSRARLSIRHANGAVDEIDFMPGHDGPGFCEIRADLGHYRLPRQDLLQALRKRGGRCRQNPVAVKPTGGAA